MYIVKNLKDYDLSHKQRIFAGYIKDNVDSFVCYEKVTNRSAMRKYFALFIAVIILSIMCILTINFYT